MKKLFRRRSSTNAPVLVHGGSTTIYSPARPLLSHRDSLLSQAETVVSNESSDERSDVLSPLNNLTDTSSPNADVLSVALSESETLFPVERLRLDLQPTYYENFSQYVPYLLRRVRLERERAQADHRENPVSRDAQDHPQNHSVLDSVDSIGDSYSVATDTERESVSSDDVKTLIENPTALTADQRQTMPQECSLIMGRQPTNFDYKRSLVLVSELLKTDYLIFPDRASFEQFKQLKANKKKKKSSVIVYDENSKILKVDKDHFFKNANVLATSVVSAERKKAPKKTDPKKSRPKAEKPREKPKTEPETPEESRENPEIEKEKTEKPKEKPMPEKESETERNEHVNLASLNIDPVPETLRESSEYSSCVVDNRHHIVPIEDKVLGKGLPLFKVSCPYMSSFRKNVPYMILKRFKEVPDRPTPQDEGDFFETYDFCTVQMKGFNYYKRYIFLFHPAGQESFKVLAFQCNLRPFTDFKFRGTRFRIFGTSMASAYILNYNPDMKLFIVDEDKPSLVDNIINKEHSHDILSIAKKKPTGQPSLPPEEPEQYQNPIPSKDNPILQERVPQITRSYDNSYIPNNMPPFSRYTDASVYLKDTLIVPKKYTESGKFDIYQCLDDSLEHFGGDVREADLSSTFSVPTDTLVLTTIFLALRETNLRTTKRYPTTNSVARMGVLATMPVAAGPS